MHGGWRAAIGLSFTGQSCAVTRSLLTQMGGRFARTSGEGFRTWLIERSRSGQVWIAAYTRSGLMDLDFFLEGFEEAWARGEEPALEAYLPLADHPAYERVLSELIRIDLERRLGRLEAVGLADYARRFPGPFQRADFVGPIAHEEYRLRRHRGEVVFPREYADRWGCDTREWSTGEPPGSSKGSEANAEWAESSMEALGEETLGEPSSLSGDSWDAMLFPPAGPLPGTGASHGAPASRSPRRFLGFEILERLGQGASAKVYLARQQALAGRLVVLKVTRGPTVEADRLARLKHSNIVPVYSHHRTGPLQVLCMPFLGRFTLLDWLRRLRDWNSVPASSREMVQMFRRQRHRDLAQANIEAELALGETPLESATPSYEARREESETGLLRWEGRSYEQTVLWLARQVVRGLAHAHDRQVLHLDIKPGNILVADDGEPLLLDFHLAQIPVAGSEPQLVGGTIPYMSPEQLTAYLDEAPLDHRSDIYSLGVMLWQLLTGQLPFRVQRPVTAAQLPALLQTRRNRLPAPPPSCLISPVAQAIVQHCVEFRPEDRYQTAYQLGVDLKRALERQPLHYARLSVPDHPSRTIEPGEGI